jgi:Nucleotidyl transferase AbiEii toxin, Type IV TA system
MTDRRYGEPAALRQALTDQLRRLALARPGAQLADLQRQFAYDRLLARVFVAEPEAWVVKGATALLARMHGSARHTVDIDLYRRFAGLDEAELALRAAASLDLGDFFRFELSPGRQVAQGRATLRIPVIAYLGATEFARFHVDLVTDLLMTGEPDEVAALVPFEIPGIDPVRYRAYPLADHVADKVCAFLEVHPRALGPAQPSTRYRDLADLALIAHTQTIAADDLGRALASEVRRRGLQIPPELPSPGAAGWRAGYARVARDVPGLPERELEAALATVRRFLDRVLDGTAAGTWDPRALTWSG